MADEISSFSGCVRLGYRSLLQAEICKVKGTLVIWGCWDVAAGTHYNPTAPREDCRSGIFVQLAAQEWTPTLLRSFLGLSSRLKQKCRFVEGHTGGKARAAFLPSVAAAKKPRARRAVRRSASRRTLGEEEGADDDDDDDDDEEGALWVACDACGKWRRMACGMSQPSGRWTCADNADSQRRACAVPEEDWDETGEYVYLDSKAAGATEAVAATVGAEGGHQHTGRPELRTEESVPRVPPEDVPQLPPCDDVAHGGRSGSAGAADGPRRTKRQRHAVAEVAPVGSAASGSQQAPQATVASITPGPSAIATTSSAHRQSDILRSADALDSGSSATQTHQPCTRSPRSRSSECAPQRRGSHPHNARSRHNAPDARTRCSVSMAAQPRGVKSSLRDWRRR